MITSFTSSTASPTSSTCKTSSPSSITVGDSIWINLASELQLGAPAGTKPRRFIRECDLTDCPFAPHSSLYPSLYRNLSHHASGGIVRNGALTWHIMWGALWGKTRSEGAWGDEEELGRRGWRANHSLRSSLSSAPLYDYCFWPSEHRGVSVPPQEPSHVCSRVFVRVHVCVLLGR